ncbi:MFS transporter [Maribacter algicola]|uniref:MFS transporter n=1 Tax=Maribacter algicola TaxID=2498892 RepID=A0A3R8QYM3_9FLAO|nr:MFS transporter [Maribacter algicola]RRQ48181.1 MFS transporter [Maribacter algicola]
MKQKPHILPTIIIAQFACTSPWFAGNTIIDELILKTGLGEDIMGWVLSSVQLGFILGTLLFALLMVADRFPPSKVFMVCALLAALCNFALLQESMTKWTILLTRFGTGFFLAGIYPVGMKIAADYYEKGLGKALGYLVGALVLGTAFPFFIKANSWGHEANTVIKITTAMTFMGGLAINFLVPNGPYRTPSKKLDLSIGPQLFGMVNFKKVAFGYFGHMWELYAFWAFTPFAIAYYNTKTGMDFSVPLWTGIVIALGGLSCALGGLISEKIGSRKVALTSLTISGLCCLISPVFFMLPPILFLSAWCIWGLAVTADSPQLSKLVAASAMGEIKGTALTLATCIGFAITIFSIQLLNYMQTITSANFLFMVLTLGPALGVWHLIRLEKD